ncbi:hypothetical protein ACOSQ4_020109 [Xanthoceras sorbifolium]
MGWLSTWSYQLILCIQLLFLHSLTHSKLCSHDQASALIHFKQLFTYSDDSPSYAACNDARNPPDQKLKNWKEDTDCCSWGGVTCDMDTGHVTGLNLTCEGLNGTIPSNTTVFLLPYLQVLSLRGNSLLIGAFPEFNSSNPLEVLDVSFTGFSGRLPNSIGNLKSMTELNLQGCNFIGSIPASLGNLTKLTDLIISFNNFSSCIPPSLSNLQNVTTLDLRNNHFVGTIPEIFVNLTQLSSLDLSSNQLSGPIPSSLSWLSNLEYFRLSDNSLNGTIPSTLFALPSLIEIDLSYNQLEAIEIGENPSNSLYRITLDNNRLHGTIPSSISELVELYRISVSSNYLSGNLEPYMFAKLTNLYYLDLSSNNLSGNLEPYLFAKLTNLQQLDLSSNNFSGNLEPYFFTNLTSLYFLDLSNNSLSSTSTTKVTSSFEAPYKLLILKLSHNKIHGKIPKWMGDLGKDSLTSLNLSHNSLTGGIEQLPWKNLEDLDLRSNLLRGQIPLLPPALKIFLISNNRLIGEIPHWICNMSALRVLDLSNNNLRGTIPECMGNISSHLNVLDLKNNSFSGTIPNTFAECHALETLNFNNNDLEGPVPPSLVHCKGLQVLDLGNNKINDTFPHWLGTLPEMQVLVLRSNKFYGPVGVSKANNFFSMLRILDLSNNNFNGSLSRRYFENLKAMMDVDKAGGKLEYPNGELQYMGDQYYQNSIKVTIKGVDIQMEKILTIFTTMDLSNNKFGGRIPDMIGKLKSLKVVNFSHNNLIGHIPLSLENMTELESLDLSSNRLEGEIPKQLTSLTSLSVLNFSYNQLVGPIPQGNQFGTFQNDCYIGNLGLCDFSLLEKCGNGEAPEPTIFNEEDNSASWFDWKMCMMGYGSGVVIGLSMGYIVFSTGKPEWFVSMVERKQSRKVKRLTRSRRRRRTT